MSGKGGSPAGSRRGEEGLPAVWMGSREAEAGGGVGKGGTGNRMELGFQLEPGLILVSFWAFRKLAGREIFQEK